MSIENELAIKELGSENVNEEIAAENRFLINGLVIEHNKSDNEKKEEELEQNTEEINCLIDALHLHMLQLMEEHISQNLALKTHLSRAHLTLARVRLQQGTFRQTVSAIHLPNLKPYRALCRLVAQGITWGSTLQLLRFGVDTTQGLLEPLTHIFGNLVPYSLRAASHKWKRCVDEIVECVNGQRELESVVRSIDRLKWSPHSRHNV